MARLKRTEAPAFWPIERKTHVWTARSIAGPHGLAESVPLSIVVRDILKLAETAREAKRIVKAGKVLVDRRRASEHNLPVGLMDVVEIPEIKKHYRVVAGDRGLVLRETGSDTDKKLCKIRGKTTLAGNRMQLNLHDGRSIISTEKGYRTGDSVVIKLPGQEITEHIKMEPGSLALITGGRNRGKLGKVVELVETKGSEPNKVILEINGVKSETQTKFVFVIGKEAPAINLGE